MNVKNITLNCRKPRHFGSSSATESSYGEKKKYKHFSQMDNDTLMLKSVLKAHDDVSKSNKMKLFKAMPKIAAGIVGTTLAITQTGKLTDKIASGVGFLVAAKVVETVAHGVDNMVDKNWKENNDSKSSIEKEVVKLGTIVAGSAIAASALIAGKSSIQNAIGNSSNGFAKLLKNDGAKLLDEINTSKLGKFVSEKVMPFEQKHASAVMKAGVIAPLASILGLSAARNKILNSITGDIHKKAVNNFVKGKIIQEIARSDFDKIDAEEV